MSVVWLDPEYERNWLGAVSTDLETRRRALNFWARRLSILPAPIQFSIPLDEQLKGVWQRLMRVSSPVCLCGERRRLWPEYSIPFHVPVDSTPVVLGPGKQLALGAWGADTQSTQIQVSVHEGHVVTHILPYTTLTRAQLQAAGVMALKMISAEIDDLGRMYIEGVPLDGVPVVREPLEALAACLAREGRPINRFIAVNLDGPNTMLNWTMYKLTAVDVAAGTISVVVSGTTQVMDRANRAAVHIC